MEDVTAGTAISPFFPQEIYMPVGEYRNSKAGNVFTDRIADVWLGRMEQYRDYKKFEKCAKCELLAWCRGCPAVASGKDGDFYAADPQCWKEVG